MECDHTGRLREGEGSLREEKNVHTFVRIELISLLMESV